MDNIPFYFVIFTFRFLLIKNQNFTESNLAELFLHKYEKILIEKCQINLHFPDFRF